MTLRDYENYEERPVIYQSHQWRWKRKYSNQYDYYDSYDYDYSYSKGGYWYGNSWRWDGGDIKSWASKFTYKKPDYQKIKEELMKEQKKMNLEWYAIKIGYGTASITRKAHGFVRCSVSDTKELKFVKTFLDKTKSMWFVTLGEVDTKILQSMLDENGEDGENVRESEDWRYGSWDEDILDDADAYQAVVDAYKPNNNSKSLDEEKRGTNRWWNSAFWLEPLDTKRINDIAEQIKNKIKLKDSRKIKEENIRRWNRINRKFVSWISYKPLINQYEEKRTKKKALCILDSSWSMGWKYHQEWRDFMEWIKKTEIFQSSVYYSSDEAMYKSDWIEYLRVGGGEWFCQLLSRLDVMNDDFDNYDYVFFFTDLQIGTAEMDEVNTICKGKKHILFNFSSKAYEERYSEQFPDLKIVTANKVQEMIETLINYV